MKSIAKLTCLMILPAILVPASGCIFCSTPVADNPSFPSYLKGWGVSGHNGKDNLAFLVLKKGEESNNGKIAVKVTDILPPQRCAEPNSFFGHVRVNLQIYNLSNPDQKCDLTELLPIEHRLIKCPFISDASVIQMDGINMYEGWAALYVR
jgi:hypothetical protein